MRAPALFRSEAHARMDRSGRAAASTRYPPVNADPLGRGLAAAFLAGVWDPDRMAERGRDALRLRADRKPPRWMLELARAARSGFPERPADAPRELGEFLAVCPLLTEEIRRRRAAGRAELRVRRWAVPLTEMVAAPAGVPQLDTVAELAGWFGLPVTTLDWYADIRSLERLVRDEALRHYRYSMLPKRTGGIRLLEAPKPRLAAMQRRVLHEILDHVTPDEAAHGFRRGRSVATFAAPHTEQDVVLRMDLEGFFASINAGRVYGVFRHTGFPEPVAHTLAALTTNTVPLAVRRELARPQRADLLSSHERLVAWLRAPHLPQGAPTSPALANLCARAMDRRLTGLARSWGASYTRYADDLAFSGPRALRDRRFHDAVAAVVAEEGFRVNVRKTRVRGQNQRQLLTGLVVNVHPQPRRVDVDQLRAVLHDAVRHGPQAANRRRHPDFAAHLLGRITWVEAHNPRRGARLRARFAEIEW
jgi:RNA-directed DNA polymerase